MNTNAIHTYKDLIVWQKGIELVSAVYDFTKDFPKEEVFGLTSQIKRAAVSIPTNIAEGRHRGTGKIFYNIFVLLMLRARNWKPSFI